MTIKRKRLVCISGGILFCLAGCVRNNPYDPEYRNSYKQLRHLAEVKDKRINCGIALVANKLYIIGGLKYTDWGGGNWGWYATDHLGVLNLQADPMVWDSVPPAPMPTKRSECKTAVVNDKIYVFGGRDSSGQILTAVEEFDPGQNSWSVKTPLPAAIIDFGVAVVNDRIYIVGGKDAASVAQARVDMYDPAQNAWTPRVSLTNARYNLGTAEMGGKIHAAGGQLNTATKYKIVEIYDPAANQWSPGTPTNSYHTAFTIATTRGLGNSYIHIIDQDSLPDYEEFDSTGGTWQVRTMVEPESIAGLSQTVNHNGKIYFTDGSNLYWFLP